MNKKLLQRLLLFMVCFNLAFPVTALADDGVGGDAAPPSGSGITESVTPTTPQTPQSEAKQPVQTSSPGIDGFQGEAAPPSGTGVEQPTTPITPPTTSRTESSVREVVGQRTQIINIDGLDVPLADGSSVYIPFVDIAKDAYYAEAVAWAYKHDPQITAGVTELSFGPNQTCTRGQMVTFLWRAAGSPEPKGDASKFTDVKAGEYYAKAVAWAVENNITLGMSDTTFEPNAPVSRAQAVTFLWRAQGKPSATAGDTYADVEAGSYYEQAVQWAAAKNVTKGTGNGFEPSTTVNRAMSVTFLYRTYVGA